MENRNIPVVPLPNPGEGGAVFSSSSAADAVPAIPLPNPGEGGPVFPGNPGSSVIQPLPDAVIPVPARYAAVRFLNATYGYAPFRIYIDGIRAVNLLDSGSASGYIRLSSGTHTISVRGQDGYIYIENSFLFTSGTTSTIAIINRTGGLHLVKIADACRVV